MFETRVPPAPPEADMDTDLERRIDQLEARLVLLERERAAAQVRLRRDRWMRLALLVIAGGAYLYYLARVYSAL